MSREEAARLVRLPGSPGRTRLHAPHLERLGFDLDVLAEESGMLDRVPRPGARPRGHDVPRPLPTRIRRLPRRRRQGHGRRREARGHERQARPRALGGREAGGGAAVRGAGREDDAGAGDRLRVLRRVPLGRPQRQAEDDAVARGGWRWRRLFDCRCRILPGWTSRGRGRGSRGG